MIILFDHGTPKGLARALPGHTIITAQARGWDTLNNGALLNAAEEAGVDVLLTTDRNPLPAKPCRTKNRPRCFDRHHEVVTCPTAP